MKRYLSIDCGGTKTAFLLCGEDGRQEAGCVLGPANYMVNGIDSVVSVLKEGILRICRQAGIGRQDISESFIAIAGLGDIPSDVPAITALVESMFPEMSITLGNDTENALAGSLCGCPGIHIIAGTGSIGLGFDKNGRHIRCGGWHHLFGGDEGSAYWIGCCLIRHFTMQADGREEKSQLYDCLMKKYGLSCPEDILKLVINQWKGSRDKIAALSRTVFELAESGDRHAVEIFERAGEELALIVKGISRRGEFDAPVRISYSGGVFGGLKYFQKTFEKELDAVPHIFCAPRLLPVAGGILLACRKSGRTPDEKMIENLKEAQDIKMK